MTELRLATWNTEWRPTGSRDAAIIRERLASFAPDIACLTECHVDFLDGWGGHTVASGTVWGYARREGRREVLLWSRTPWREADIIGSESLPPGRFARAVTDTVLGAITVIGIVIPYHFAHVRHGRRDRQPWQEHLFTLDALRPILDAAHGRCIVLGDYNQRIPSRWVPKDAQRKREKAFERFTIVTAGDLTLNGHRAIDHIAVDPSLSATSVDILSNIGPSGVRISDHFGVTSTIGAAVRASIGDQKSLCSAPIGS